LIFASSIKNWSPIIEINLRIMIFIIHIAVEKGSSKFDKNTRVYRSYSIKLHILHFNSIFILCWGGNCPCGQSNLPSDPGIRHLMDSASLLISLHDLIYRLQRDLVLLILPSLLYLLFHFVHSFIVQFARRLLKLFLRFYIFFPHLCATFESGDFLLTNWGNISSSGTPSAAAMRSAVCQDTRSNFFQFQFLRGNQHLYLFFWISRIWINPFACAVDEAYKHILCWSLSYSKTLLSVAIENYMSL